MYCTHACHLKSYGHSSWSPPLPRCTNPPKEEEEEGEEGAAKPKEPEPEKETPALTPASEDVC